MCDVVTQPACCVSKRGSTEPVRRWARTCILKFFKETQKPSHLVASGKQAEQGLSQTVVPVPGWVVPASQEPGAGGGPLRVGVRRLTTCDEPACRPLDPGAGPQGAAGPEDGQRGRCQEPGQEAGGPAEGDREPGQVRGGPRARHRGLGPWLRLWAGPSPLCLQGPSHVPSPRSHAFLRGAFRPCPRKLPSACGVRVIAPPWRGSGSPPAPRPRARLFRIPARNKHVSPRHLPGE